MISIISRASFNLYRFAFLQYVTDIHVHNMGGKVNKKQRFLLAKVCLLVNSGREKWVSGDRTRHVGYRERVCCMADRLGDGQKKTDEETKEFVSVLTFTRYHKEGCTRTHLHTHARARRKQSIWLNLLWQTRQIYSCNFKMWHGELYDNQREKRPCRKRFPRPTQQRSTLL